MRHDAHGYWLSEAPIGEPLPAAEGAIDCDFLVVGGGYTGMWAAWRLAELEPGADVVLIEADQCGRGPSGRNGGFVNEMWFHMGSMRDRYGDEGAVALGRASTESVEAIGRFCDEQDVDAWFRKGGYLQVSAAPAQDGVWEPAVRATHELGEPEAVTVLDAAELAKRCRSPRFRGAAFFPGAATVQPARLARGLRDRLAAKANVRVFERSPLRAIRAGAWGCEAETPRGRIRAGSCVLAIGSAAAAAGSPLRGRLTVTSSHMVITEPVPDVIEEAGWTGGECITDGRAMLHYFRTTPDGRIAFGWGGGMIACGARLGGRTEVDPAVSVEVADHLRSFFPGLEGREVVHAWGGPIDVTPTHLPAVVQVGSDRLWAAFGYTGNGVGPAQMVGRVLASLALDRRDDDSRLAVVEPQRERVPGGLAGWAGGNAIRAGLLAKEAAEEEERVAGAIHRGLASIPERIGFHIGR